MPAPKLTHRQEAYVQRILAGARPYDAYVEAGYAACKGNQRSVKAAELARKPHVAAAIEAGRAAMRQAGHWSREDMLRTLRGIAEGERVPAGARTQAIAQASKMLGLDAPTKVEQSGELVVKWAE
jgi:phage terminase small subunit